MDAKVISLQARREAKGQPGPPAPVLPAQKTRTAAQIEELAALVDDALWRVKQLEKKDRKWEKRWLKLLTRLFGTATGSPLQSPHS